MALGKYGSWLLAQRTGFVATAKARGIGEARWLHGKAAATFSPNKSVDAVSCRCQVQNQKECGDSHARPGRG